jgi:hypothetical protein
MPVTCPQLRILRNRIYGNGKTSMKLTLSFFSRRALMVGVGAVLCAAGCSADWLMVKQKVMIDAISAPGAPKPAGQSYRLLARRSVVSGQQVQLPVIKACVDAALLQQGMYEAPPNVPSDIFIEVNFGMDTSSRVDPSTRESFLQLSARANHRRVIDTSQEEELWDVRTAITGLAGRLETAMPLLATVAARYAGTDTHAETIQHVADNSPEVSAVRDNAVKSLAVKVAPAAKPAK